MKGQGVHFFPIDEFDQFYIRWPSWLKLLAKRYISLQLKILIHFKFDDRARHLKPSRYVATLSSLNILLPELMLLPKVLRYVTPMGMLLHGSICYHPTWNYLIFFFYLDLCCYPTTSAMLLHGPLRWACCYMELSVILLLEPFDGHDATWSSRKGMLLPGALSWVATLISDILLPGLMLLSKIYRYVTTWTSPMAMLLPGAL